MSKKIARAGNPRKLAWNAKEQRLVPKPCLRCQLGIHKRDFCNCGCLTCGYNLS